MICLNSYHQMRTNYVCVIYYHDNFALTWYILCLFDTQIIELKPKTFNHQQNDILYVQFFILILKNVPELA
jgi:hypothetical protein